MVNQLWASAALLVKVRIHKRRNDTSIMVKLQDTTEAYDFSNVPFPLVTDKSISQIHGFPDAHA